MTLPNRSPYQSLTRLKFAKIGTPDTGYIYLMERGGVTPSENPVDLEMAMQRQSEVTVLLMNAVKSCSEKDGISRAEARERIFPSRKLTLHEFLDATSVDRVLELLDKALQSTMDTQGCTEAQAKEQLFPNRARIKMGTALSPEEGEEFSKLLDTAVRVCAGRDRDHDRASARATVFDILLRPAVEVVADADLYDYLDGEQVSRLLLLQGDTQETMLRAATQMIRYRLLYPVIATGSAKAKANQIEIEPLRFPLVRDNRIRFGSTVVVVGEETDYDSPILQTENLARAIEADEVGFLLDISGREKIGDPDWTENHTAQYLLESQIAEIYAFYENEIGQKTTGKGEEGNSTKQLPPSPSTSAESPLTGTPSIGASNGLVSATKGSPLKTLATNPTG